MQLKSKYVVLGVSLMAVAAVNAWLSMKSLDLANQQEISIQLMQRHMNADMEHDGIRGNVYSTMVALKLNDGELLKDSRKEVAEMSEDFAKQVDENLAADIPANLKQQFEVIKKSVAAYGSFSHKISNENSFEAAAQELPEFNKVFGVLEEDQGKATEMILAWSDELNNTAHTISLYSKGAIVIMLLLSIIIPALSFRLIFNPLSRMIAAMQALTKGNTSVEVPYQTRHDEVGDMARAVEVFKENSQKVSQLGHEQQQRFELEMKKQESVSKLLLEFDSNAKYISSTVSNSASEFAKTAGDLSASMSKTTQLAQQATDGSTQTISTVKTAAAAAEQLSASVREISGQLQKTSQLVGLSKEKAESADVLAQNLSSASDKVAGAMEMIAQIAGQINLLALNATIESARAGDAGKGFAVVASEVKNLANQTDKSVNDIQQVISEMRDASNAIISALHEIKSSVVSITEATSNVAAAVEQQSAATSDIARNMQTAASGTQVIMQNLSEVNHSAADAKRSAGDMLSAAQGLSDEAKKLNKQVDSFLNEVKAA